MQHALLQFLIDRYRRLSVFAAQNRLRLFGYALVALAERTLHDLLAAQLLARLMNQ